MKKHFEIRFPPHAVLMAVVLLAGCKESIKELNPLGTEVDVDKQLETLSALEQVTDYGLYEFIFTAGREGNVGSLLFSKGVLLANDQGVFRFEQETTDPRRSFSVYFDPRNEIRVTFPRLKTAYKGNPSLLSEPDLVPALAAYDGMRLFLGLSNVWSSPEANAVESHPLTGKASFQEPGRPYRWEVTLLEDPLEGVFEELRAKNGLTTEAILRRKKVSIKSYDRSAWQSFVGDEGDGGQTLTFTVWELEMAGSKQKAQIQFTPYAKTAITPQQVREHLQSVKLPSDFEVKNLSVPLLKRWLNLR